MTDYNEGDLRSVWGDLAEQVGYTVIFSAMLEDQIRKTYSACLFGLEPARADVFTRQGEVGRIPERVVELLQASGLEFAPVLSIAKTWAAETKQVLGDRNEVVHHILLPFGEIDPVSERPRQLRIDRKGRPHQNHTDVEQLRDLRRRITLSMSGCVEIRGGIREARGLPAEGWMPTNP